MNFKRHCSGMRWAIVALASLPAIALLATDITGRVTDGAGEPLMQATVRLLRVGDSTFVSGTSADIDGRFNLSGVKPGKYIVETNYVGFAPTTLNIQVGNETMSLKPIVMSESTNLLKEVSVIGVKTPIKVMTDTVEFNADSYLTRPNAVVEDLLKRLPGVEVDSEGKITANGKEVTKILIDGKEFFSDDPKVASKNLPADMVNKLQVIDRKSDLARLTGVDDGEDETVINLSVKKEMKNGWFGTAEGGYGTDRRYTGSFNISSFKNDNQFTFLGNFNNINELGFTDGNGNRFRRFWGNNGITASQALGLNFNVGNGEIFRVGGDVMYSHSDKDAHSRSERQWLFPDSTSYTSSRSFNRDKGHNVRGDFRVLWQPDSFNILEIRPNFSLNFNRSNSLDSTLTRAGDPAMSRVNSMYNDVASKGNSFEMGARLIYTHNFASHRGRSFSTMVNYRMSNVREKEISFSRNLFYLLNDSVDVYDQFTDNHTWSNTVGARVTWTEPLGNVSRGNFLTLSYQMTYRWNNADKLVYDRDYDHDNYGFLGLMPDDIYNNNLSNRFRNTFFSQNIRIGYKKVTSKINFDGGVSLVPSRSQSTNLTNSEKNIPSRSVWNIAPFVRFRYKINKNRSFNMHYNGRSSEPSMNQLQPVADMSDPMRIIQGNPDLDPTFTHRVMLRFQDFNMDAQRSIMAMAHVNFTQNSIVSRTTFNDQTGGQVTTYENVNGVWNAMLMNMISFPLRNKAFTFSNHLFMRFAKNVGFSNGLRNSTFNTNLRIEPALAFRPSNLELELRPVYGLQTTHTSVATNVNRTIHNYGGRFNGTYYTKFGLSISTDLDFSATSGYSSGYDQKTWKWNAQLSYQFLRDQSATIAVKVYDILGQTKNISRNVTASYIEDIDYNELTRYFMATFTYRFNTFGKGKQPESRNNGPGGPRRMGPPGGPR